MRGDPSLHAPYTKSMLHACMHVESYIQILAWRSITFMHAQCKVHNSVQKDWMEKLDKQGLYLIYGLWMEQTTVY